MFLLTTWVDQFAEHCLDLQGSGFDSQPEAQELHFLQLVPVVS